VVEGRALRPAERVEHPREQLTQPALEPPQRDDAVEPLDLVRAVAAVPRGRALARREEAELVGVVERADAQARPGRELSDVR